MSKRRKRLIVISLIAIFASIVSLFCLVKPVRDALAGAPQFLIPGLKDLLVSSIVEFKDLPQQYEVIAFYPVSANCSEVVIHYMQGKEVTMPIFVMQVQGTKSDATPQAVIDRIVREGLPNSLVWSDGAHRYVIGQMTVSERGTIPVGGRNMSYVLGTTPKAYFAVEQNMVIPAFVGCVMTKNDRYALVYADEPDGWLPEAKRKVIQDTGSLPGKDTAWDNKQPMTKEFDIAALKTFLGHIKSFKD